MKRIAPKTEHQAVLCFLETKNPEIRGLLLQSLEPEDFGLEWAHEVYERILVLRKLGKPIGRVANLLEDIAISEASRQWLRGKANDRRSARRLEMDRVEAMIRTLHAHRKIRIVHDNIEKLLGEAEGKVNSKNFDAMERHCESILHGLRRTQEKDPFFHLGKRANVEAVKNEVKEITDPSLVNFVSTGIDALNEHMRGFEPGSLVSVSGPSGGGKSLVASAMAIEQYRRNKHDVCIVSMEMTKRQVLQRAIANLAEQDFKKVRDPSLLRKRQVKDIYSAVSKFMRWGKRNDCEFSIRDVANPEYDPYKMENELTPLHYDVIYVDYITLFSMKGFNQAWEMQMEYSRVLKQMAQKHGWVVVLLTQLSDDEKIKYGRAILENSDYWLYWNWDAQSREYQETDIVLEKARHAEGNVKFRAKFNFSEMNLIVFGRDTSGYVPEHLRAKGGRASDFDTVGKF